MIGRPLALFLLVSVALACSPGTTAPTIPATMGVQGTPAGPDATAAGPGATPVSGPTTAPGGGGNLESLARSLVPPGSNEISVAPAGGSYTIIVSTTMSIDQLKAFYAQAIPASGATSTGQLDLSGSLTITLANPDGGIVVSPAGSEGNLITISVGIT